MRHCSTWLRSLLCYTYQELCYREVCYKSAPLYLQQKNPIENHSPVFLLLLGSSEEETQKPLSTESGLLQIHTSGVVEDKIM